MVSPTYIFELKYVKLHTLLNWSYVFDCTILYRPNKDDSIVYNRKYTIEAIYYIKGDLKQELLLFKNENKAKTYLENKTIPDHREVDKIVSILVKDYIVNNANSLYVELIDTHLELSSPVKI